MKTCAALFLLLLALPAAAEDIYRWKDDKGRMHFSQQPPRDGKFEKIVVNPLPSTPNPEVQSLGAYADALGAPAATPAPPAAVPGQAAAAGTAPPAAAPARDPQRCSVAQSRLLQLGANAPNQIVVPDGKGGTRPMTGAEHSAETARMRQMAAQNCAGAAP